MKGMKLLRELAARIAQMDDRITEVFIHGDTPKDPFKGEEIFLICHVADPEINRDEQAFEDAGYQWGLDISEAVQPMAQELGIEQEVIVNPFNFEMYNNGEYGQYYATLFLREGFEPILDRADRERKEQEESFLNEAQSEE